MIFFGKIWAEAVFYSRRIQLYNSPAPQRSHYSVNTGLHRFSSCHVTRALPSRLKPVTISHMDHVSWYTKAADPSLEWHLCLSSEHPSVKWVYPWSKMMDLISYHHGFELNGSYAGVKVGQNCVPAPPINRVRVICSADNRITDNDRLRSDPGT